MLSFFYFCFNFLAIFNFITSNKNHTYFSEFWSLNSDCGGSWGYYALSGVNWGIIGCFYWYSYAGHFDVSLYIYIILVANPSDTWKIYWIWEVVLCLTILMQGLSSYNPIYFLQTYMPTSSIIQEDMNDRTYNMI